LILLTGFRQRRTMMPVGSGSGNAAAFNFPTHGRDASGAIAVG
jgi:H+/Cl- antiporter ClcA